MAKNQFKKELMRHTVWYLMILFIVIFVVIGFFFGSIISKVKESDNKNFLALMKSQTDHYLEHPMAEITFVDEELKKNGDYLNRTEEDYHNYVQRIELLNSEGIVEITFPEKPGRVGMDRGGNPFIAMLQTDQVTFSDTFIDSLSGERVMMVGKKRVNGETLIGYMTLDKLAYTFSTFKTEDSIFAIVDNRGSYILNSDPILVKSMDVDPYILGIQNGAIHQGDLVSYNNKLNSIYYSPIENTEWFLLIYEDYYQTYGPILISSAFIIFFMLASFFVALRSFRVSFNKLDEGFSKFVKMTKSVSEGDYTAIESEQAFIEFDELSSNFITMIAEIESREEDIQKFNYELLQSREALKTSNDELHGALKQLMAIEREQRDQNDYLDRQNTRLENLIKGTNAGTWEWDIVTGEIIVNVRWAEMLGYNLDDLTPFTLDKFYTLVHPEERATLDGNLEPILKLERELFESKFRMKHYNGKWIWINSIAKVSKLSETRNPLMLSGIHIDITESVHSALRIQERLVETELIAKFTSDLLVLKNEGLFDVISSLLDKVCTLKGHKLWEIQLFNTKEYTSIFEREEKYSKLLPLGDKTFYRVNYPILYDLLHNESRVTIFSEVAFGNRESLERKWLHEKKHKCILMSSLFEEQELAGYIAFDTDCEGFEVDKDERQFYKILANVISEAIKKGVYEKGLIESREMAKAANVAKSQFLANMSHEIRTPLNGISGYLQLILSSDQLEEVREFGNMANRVTNSMIPLIDDILDFSKIEAGKLKIMNEPVNFREKLTEVVDMYRFDAYRKEISLNLQIAEGLPQIIITDATRLKQILSNLISNAIKFSSEGSIAIDVNYTVEDGDLGVLTMVVTDCGIGIPANQINAVFEPFNQGDNTSKRRFGGTGLGLSIVKQLLELMSGSIEVMSVSGEGSAFTVKLPAVIGESVAFNPDLKQAVEKSVRIKESRILIVDDNVINQIVVMKVLENKGFLCDVASNGLEALDMIKANNYDCVFMDVQMPIMDGYEATKAIRNMSEKTDLYVIAMTANAMEGDRERCLSAGMDDYLSKPLDYNRMVELVLKHKTKSIDRF